jgi:flagellar basal-body rod protein FlgF
MANGIYVAVSGAKSRIQQLDVLANNLANTKTTAFKRAELSFHSIQAGEEGSPQADRHFVQTRESRPSLDNGELIRTDNPLDLAIQGDAFFKVEADGEERLTRDGRLMVSSDGLLRTMNGHAIIDDQGGTIYVPPEHVPRIDSNGRVYSNQAEIGQIALVGVEQLANLERDGTHLFIPPDDAQNLGPDSGVLVQQGWVEGSNAKPLQLMVQLVSVHRAFDAMTKAISTYQDMDRNAIRITR